MNRVRGQGSGFTIVETMIFLAISGALLVSAILAIGGQQQKTQFNATVKDLDNKIQSVMGNVATGYYNSTGKVECVAPADVITALHAGGSQDQGTSDNCTFIGQVMVPSASSNDFKIYSIVGLRRATVAGVVQEVDELSQASPRLYDDPATIDTYSLNSANFGWIKYNGISSGSLAFLTSFVGHADGSLRSGSTNTGILVIQSVDTSFNSGFSGASISDYLKRQGDLGGGQLAKNPDSIQICITDGTRQGIIELKGGSTQSTIGSGDCS